MEKTFSEFLNMSGYAGYVWSAFGLTLFVMIALFVISRSQYRRKLEELKRRNSA